MSHRHRKPSVLVKAEPPVSNHSLFWAFLVAVITLASFSEPAFSEDEEAEAEGQMITGSSYVKIDPAFVTNYGGTTRLRYLKVDVTLKVANGKGPAQVAHHMPAIKDKMLSLLSQQSSEAVGSASGKEALRQESLIQISEIVAAEDGESFIQEVLFTDFVAHTL